MLPRAGRVLATTATATALVVGSGTAAHADTAPPAPATPPPAAADAAPSVQATTSAPTTASAPAPAAAHQYAGRIVSGFQYRDGAVRVTGFLIDRLHPRRRVWGCIHIRGRCARLVHADRPSPAFDRRQRVAGPHRFELTLRPQRAGVRLALRTTVTDRMLGAVRATTPGARVVRVARRYVGDRYVWGAASPRAGFDCSGYAMYSYRRAQVAQLPHNANAQRFAPHMHRIGRRDARPGDLVFYLSGGYAYHVAIFAGRGMQYSATDPAVGVQYARIRAHNIVFGTDWHR